MKIITTWTDKDRGSASDCWLTLAIGSASPHLLNAFGGIVTGNKSWFGLRLAALDDFFLPRRTF
jgi:hypothetical protein